jgi:2-polyprenyl-3-methyl-5-hydroxy-6-metoxy-1,4-benzoquinol methylase
MNSKSKDLARERPIIRRSWIYDHLPQYPSWFLNAGHVEAKVRYLRKLKNQYGQVSLMACPQCGGDDFVLLANQERSGLPTSVVVCKKCELAFTNPRLDEAALLDHYARDYRGIERGSIDNVHEFLFNLQMSKGPIIWDKLCAGNITARSGASVVDIGCGEGGLLRWFADNTAFSSVHGFELNKAAASFGRSLGIDVKDEVFNCDQQYDLVLLEQVLEHIGSPEQLLATIAKSQPEGAWLYIGVPGILNYAKHYGKNFIAYLQYGHMFHYSLHTLERLVAPFGYRLVYGDETVYAVFQRSREAALPTTQALGADQLIAHMKKSESDYLAQGSQLNREWVAYRQYIGLLAKAWWRSLTGLSDR